MSNVSRKVITADWEVTIHLINKTVKNEVMNYIKGEIQQGNLKAGEKLPSEEKLSKKLNISRASLREALQKLEMVGLIEIEHGKGSFVSLHPSINGLKNFIPPLVLANKKDIIELLEARRFVEIGTARLAAENVDGEDLAQLKGYLSEMRSALENEDRERFQQNDLKFHLHIAKSSGNTILFKLLQTLREFMVKELNIILKIPGRVESSLRLHTEIMKTIEKGDGVKAGKVIISIFQTQVKILKAQLSKKENIFQLLGVMKRREFFNGVCSNHILQLFTMR